MERRSIEQKTDFIKWIGQWLMIAGALIGVYVSQDRRITAVEISSNEQAKGFVAVIAVLNARLDRIENKIDRAIERK